MIDISQINDKYKPYKKFKDLYVLALESGQRNLEAICISSFNPRLNSVNSRYVNLKYIKDEKWIFFSNYESPKSFDFSEHPQISCTIFWNKINIQIRIMANIRKTSAEISDSHFEIRTIEKNALAISSDQSMKIKSFSDVENAYKSVLKNNDCYKRPDYWGGFEFSPYYFEFWQGNRNRLNKREAYEKNKTDWEDYILSP